MCGLIAFISKNNNGKDFLLEQYERQHERGKQGFGLVEVNKKGITVKRATEPVKALLDIHFNTAPILLFHHRMPTSTSNKLEQTHPIYVSHDDLEFDYLVMHNGVIANADELKKVHEEEFGYKYRTIEKGQYQKDFFRFNDSEAFAIELCRFLDGDYGLMNVRGSAAFITLRLDKKTGKPVDIIWGRNDRNPLSYTETEEGLLIASELEDSVDVEINSALKLSLKTVFESKKGETFFMLQQAETIPLVFKQPEPVKEETEHRYHGMGRMGFQQPLSGFGDSTKKETDTSSIPKTGATAVMTGKDAEKIQDEFNDPNFGLTDRAIAFKKMADRVMEKIADSISGYYYNLAYEDDEESNDMNMDLLADEIWETLFESRERATQARYFFDGLIGKKYYKKEESRTEDEKSFHRMSDQEIEAYYGLTEEERRLHDTEPS